jgi:hypothetical protein
MEKSIVKYVHHGVEVSVREDLKGQHRDYCLCHLCKCFNTESQALNCKIANAIFENCVTNHVTTPVFECPEFESKES